MVRPASPLRDFFTRHLGYKLVALLLALLLWFDVTTDEMSVVEYPVPLTIVAEGGNDVIITNDVPSSVEVSFSGTGKELLRLDRDELEIYKEIRGGENDTTTIVLAPQDVRRPAHLRVSPVGIAPGQIIVVTDRFIEKTVRLEPTGQPVAEPGFQVLNVTVEPRQVTLRGVTAQLGLIGSLGLDLTQLTQVAGPFDQRLEIAVPESLDTVTVSPDSVRIRGTVVEVRALEDGDE